MHLYAKIPKTPGVYLMKDARGALLYIGKAANLYRRVSSYFIRPHLRQGYGGQAHDERIQKLVRQIKKIEYRRTDTAIEALILEAELIKKHSPPFNVKERDDKSFLYIEVTGEEFPRVLLVRGKNKPNGKRFGPFTSASSVRQALRILRRIFPFAIHSAPDVSSSKPLRACFDYQVGLCPGTCINAISKQEYRKNISNLKLFFQNKKLRIIRSFKREMSVASKRLEFERAEHIKRRLFALQHIQDVALITDERLATDDNKRITRIEGYDISNISGTSATGSMVVFVNGKPARSEYRKFKIKTIEGANDVGMLKEVMTRRLRHAPQAGTRLSGGQEWVLPDLILVDGGAAQVRTVREVLRNAGVRVPVIGIAKGPERKRNDVVGLIPKSTSKEVLIRVRDEAHRFAVRYHTVVRRRSFFT